jgi:Putative Ig domain
MNKLLLLFSLCFLIACSTDKTSDTDKLPVPKEGEESASGTSTTSVAYDGSYSIEINPSEATRNSILSLTVKGFKLEEVKIEWLVNGSNIAPQETSKQFKTAEANKGDTVQAKAVIDDKEILSNTVIIGNAPPELSSLKIMPEVFKPDYRLYVDAAANDADGDDVSIAFEWTLNGELAGSTKEITSEVKRGDKISVKVTPYDGETYGRSITLNREIRNLPPMLAKENKPVFDGNTYTYQINAVDPDGDDLTYTLKEAPQGMTIDSASGFLTWEVPPGDTENHNIQVLISDNQGGELLAPFTLKINPKSHNP